MASGSVNPTGLADRWKSCAWHRRTGREKSTRRAAAPKGPNRIISSWGAIDAQDPGRPAYCSIAAFGCADRFRGRRDGLPGDNDQPCLAERRLPGIAHRSVRNRRAHPRQLQRAQSGRPGKVAEGFRGHRRPRGRSRRRHIPGGWPWPVRKIHARRDIRQTLAGHPECISDLLRTWLENHHRQNADRHG